MMPSRFHLAAALLLSFAAPGAAQAPSGAVRFAGCWDPAAGLPARTRICIAPEAGGVRITTVPQQGEVTESALRFDGERVAVKSDDCSGWESARLTADGERIVVKAEITCGAEPRQKRETTYSITPSGLLLQATGTGLGLVASAQIRVFEPVNSYGSVAPAIRDAVLPHLVAAERARLEQREHPVSARDLVELESLGVSAPLIDLIVAAAYPRSFVIDAQLGSASAAVPERGGNAFNNSSVDRFPSPGLMFMNGFPMLSMYDWQRLYDCGWTVGLSCAALGPNGPWGFYGFNSGFGGRYLTGFNGGYWPTNGYYPVVVRPAAPAAPDGGRAVRGRGYTQSGNSGGGTAQPRSTAGPSSGSSGNSSSGGASSRGSSSTGSSSSGGSTRTAKPRPPGA